MNPQLATILLIDDEEQLRKLLSRIISLEGFKVVEASSLQSAKNILDQNNIDIALCDVKLPDGNGVDFVKELKAKAPLTEVILLTAYGNIADGVKAVKNGAFDYITKGNDNDRIIPLLYQALEIVQANKSKAVKVNDQVDTSFESIIGKSKLISDLIVTAKKAAPSNASVLLLGETGTGKEIFARAIHNASKKSKAAFVAINCSAFAKDLLEGELFGYKAGAYTGAQKDKKGLIEIADGGTMFLDEIGEMNLELQAKILRVIENGEFIKLGDTKTTKVNVRLIAATNVNLEKAVTEGKFREDLYYRLNTFILQLPPLRHRKEDIPDIVFHFVDFFGKREGRKMKIDETALKLLKDYKWKGNIRELRNRIERAVILAENDTISVNDLPLEINEENSSQEPISLAEVEKVHIKKILSYSLNNKTKAAQLLGIGIATLYRKLEEYGIK